MSCYRKLALAILLVADLRGESLTTFQPGISVSVNTWTQVCPANACNGPFGSMASSSPVHATGFDNLITTGNGLACFLGGYKDITSEQNRALWCWDFTTDRWSLVDIGSAFTNQHITGGHPDNVLAADPTSTYLFMPQQSGSGSQGTGANWVTMVYDLQGRYGRVTTQLTQTLPISAQASAIYDYTRIASGKQGVLMEVKNGGTAEYDPWANTWGSSYCTTNGTGCPPSGINAACLVWDDVNQSAYLFGGLVSTTVQNAVFQWKSGTWSSVSTTGGPPTAREFPSCAFNHNRNHILVFSGCTVSSNCNANTLTDTWTLDVSQSPAVWAQLSPTGTPSLSGPVFERLTYIPAYDIYVTVVQPPSGDHQTWVLREDPGPNVGFVGTGTSITTSGGINFSTSNWAKDSSVATSGNTISAGWIETGLPSVTCPPANGNSSGCQHPNSATFSAGAWTQRPSGGNDLSMMPLFNGTQYSVNNDTSCNFVSTTFWCAWGAFNNSTMTARIFASNYSGSWSTGQLGFVGSTGPTQGGSEQIVGVNGVPTAAFREYDTVVTNPPRTQLYVKQFTAGAWGSPLGGVALNRIPGTNPATRAEVVSIAATTGSNFCVGHTEYTQATSGLPITVTATGAYVDCWNGTSFQTQAGNIAVTSTDTVSAINITAIGTSIYACLVERNQNGTGAGFPTGTQQLFLLTSVVGSNIWTELGGAALSRDTATGWVTDCAVGNDGTNVYVATAEQNNEATWTGAARLTSIGQVSRIFVLKWNGLVVTTLGACVNMDCVNGSAQHPSIVGNGGLPIITWEEKNINGLSQIYAKQLSTAGDWGAVTGGSVQAPTTPTAPAKTMFARNGN